MATTDREFFEPIKGQSHWCDGRTLRGEKCCQIVSDSNDHCAAGHPNKTRQHSTKTSAGLDKTSSPATKDALSLTTDTLLGSAPKPPGANVFEQMKNLFAGIIEEDATADLAEDQLTVKDLCAFGKNSDNDSPLLLFSVGNDHMVGIWPYEDDPYWDTWAKKHGKEIAVVDPQMGSWAVILYDADYEPIIDEIGGVGWDDLRDVVTELKERSRTRGGSAECDYTNCPQAAVREVLGKRLCGSHASEFEDLLNSRCR